MKCVCDAETLLVLISMVARESTVYFRKSKSKFKFARLFKPDAVLFTLVHDFPLYFFVFVTLGFATSMTAPRFVFGSFPQASTANIGLSELTSLSTLNGLFPP